MVYSERLLIEIGDPDLNGDAIRMLSKVLPIYFLFFCPIFNFFNWIHN